MFPGRRLVGSTILLWATFDIDVCKSLPPRNDALKYPIDVNFQHFFILQKKCLYVGTFE